MKLIPLDALVAEIERRRGLHYKYYMKHGAGSIAECKYDEDRDILTFIHTLEVKEVDLMEEIADIYEANYEEYLTYEEFADIAKHFFELGIKAKKDNIRHSMNETPNYPCDILFVTNVDNMFLYRYMENGRPVDNETPYFHNILNGKCWYYCNDIVNK